MTSHATKAAALTIEMLLLLECVGSGIVFVTFKFQGDNSTAVFIKFYSDTFQKFYDCLTTNTSKQCNAEFTTDLASPQRANDKSVSTVETSNSLSGGPVNAYFACKNDLEVARIVCIRQTAIMSTCETGLSSKVFNFQLKESPQNSYKCVGILMNNGSDDIIFEDVNNFETCNPFCLKNVKTKARKSSRRSGKTDTIIGIVASGVIFIVVAVVGITLWRRAFLLRKACGSRPVCHGGMSDSDSTTIVSAISDDSGATKC